jgi:hypothetical protein
MGVFIKQSDELGSFISVPCSIFLFYGAQNYYWSYPAVSACAVTLVSGELPLYAFLFAVRG